MARRASSSVLPSTFLLFLFFSAASAFNITRLLSQFPEFGQFNDLLTKTELYKQINARRTITVLALDNGSVSSVAGNSLDVVKEILSVHVILDYYDLTKLRKLSTEKSTVLTTMFQSTGIAMNQQGFIKVVQNKNGEVEFESAAKGGVYSKLIKAVAAQPYNISVLQIASPIFVPGIGVPPPPSAPVPVPAPKKAPAAAPTPDADAPAPVDDADADAPAADVPSPADAPDAESPDAPASSPPKPADDVDDADAPSPDSDDSGASRIYAIGAGAVIGGLALSMSF